MKRIILIGAAVTVAAIFSACLTTEQAGSSPTPSPTAAMEIGASAEQEVRSMGLEYDKAYVQQDAAALDRILADEFTLIQIDGKVISKAEMIAAAKSGDVKVEVGKAEDSRIRIYGDTALVKGRWIEKSTSKGRVINATMQTTTVYVKRDGRWQIVSDQVTAIAPQKTRS
jgi:ketosteroid isomerase-like protein